MEAFGGMLQGVNEVAHQGFCDFSRVLEISTHGIKWFTHFSSSICML
jgi:hypothetical protein